MNRRGHQGAGLLALAAAAATTIYTGIFQFSVTALVVYLLTGVLVYWTALLPDQVERLLGVRHRTWMHSILILALLAAIVFYAARTAIHHLNQLDMLFFGEHVAIYLSLIVFFSSTLHVSVDCFSRSGSYQAQPLYPLSSWGVSLSLYSSSSKRLNWFLHRLGVLAFLVVPGYWVVDTFYLV